MKAKDNKIMSHIVVNDIFEELSEENKRLLNELMFANKCLNVLKRFKAFIDFNFNHLKTILDSKQSQDYDELLKEVDKLFIEENINYMKFNKTLFSESLPTHTKKMTIKVIPKKRNTKPSTKTSQNGTNCEEIIDQKPIITEINGFIANNKKNKISIVKQFKCEVEECKKSFEKRINLIRHQKRSHSHITFPCDWPGCDFTARTKDWLTRHVKRLHENNGKKVLKILDCEIEGCGQQFVKRELLEGHINRHKGIKPFVCKDNACDKTFFSSYNMKQHYKTCHVIKVKAFKCEVESCGKAFKTNGQLICHSYSHNTTKVFGCQLTGCDFKTHNRQSYYAHMNLTHTMKRYACPVEGCGKVLKNKTYLNYHITNVHKETNDRFACDSCGKTFKNTSLVRKHVLRMHSDNPTVYFCDWPGCPFSTNTKGSLTAHSASHSNERQFRCDWPECGKRFNIKSKLQEHLRIHRGEKKYACSWPGCGYRCVFGGNLRKHMRVHQK